jgi:hypothetical protein
MHSLSRRLRFSSTIPALATLTLTLLTPFTHAQENNQPPAGFKPLFNGKDFDEWTGGADRDPREIAGLTGKDRDDWREKMHKGIHEHWRVDADKGELVSDGKTPFLATPRDYGDVEMWVDWKIGKNGDSGIYLRGTPQIQIWDPENKEVIPLGADKGSGALWNNKRHEKNPLAKADHPIGEWNRMYIRIVGPYVLVKLNDKLTVNNVPLENYFDKSGQKPIPARGPIYLQTHGSETRFRNVFVREIPAEESNKILADIGDDQADFKPVFNGKDLTGWTGATDSYSAVDGSLKCTGGTHGNLFTDDTYDNFIVRLEFKLPPGGNNGLAIRAPKTEGDIAYEGMELQVLDHTHPKYKDLHDYQFHGSLYGLAPAQHDGYLRPVGEWNYEQVKVDGDNIVVELNGSEILNTSISKAAEKPMDGKEHPGASRKEGHFGFLGHQDPVEFRNIRIKRLSNSANN